MSMFEATLANGSQAPFQHRQNTQDDAEPDPWDLPYEGHTSTTLTENSKATTSAQSTHNEHAVPSWLAGQDSFDPRGPSAAQALPPSDVSRRDSLLSRMGKAVADPTSTMKTTTEPLSSPSEPPSNSGTRRPREQRFPTTESRGNHFASQPDPANAQTIDPVPRPGRTRDSGWATRPTLERKDKVAEEHEGAIQRYHVVLSQAEKVQSRDGDPKSNTFWAEKELSAYRGLVDAMRALQGKDHERDQQKKAMEAIVKYFPTAQRMGKSNSIDLVPATLDAVYDLCEERLPESRMIGYEALGGISKHAERQPFQRNVDILCQLLSNPCSPDELASLSQTVRTHLLKDPASTLQIMFAFLTEDCTEAGTATATVRAHILDCLAEHSNDLARALEGQPSDGSCVSQGDALDAEAHCQFMAQICETMLKSTSLAELWHCVQLVRNVFSEILWMSDVDLTGCPLAETVIALRQRWIDTLCVSLLSTGNASSKSSMEYLPHLIRSDTGPTKPRTALEASLLAANSIEMAVFEQYTSARDHQKDCKTGTLPQWTHRLWHNTFALTSEAYQDRDTASHSTSILNALSLPVQWAVVGSTAYLVDLLSDEKDRTQLLKDTVNLISAHIPRRWSSAKNSSLASSSSTVPIDTLVLCEPVLFALLKLLTAPPNELTVGHTACLSAVLQGSFQDRVHSLLNAASAGSHKADIFSWATKMSSGGSASRDALVEITRQLLYNIRDFSKRLFQLPSSIQSPGRIDAHWITSSTNCVNGSKDQLQWEKCLMACTRLQSDGTAHSMEFEPPTDTARDPSPAQTQNHQADTLKRRAEDESDREGRKKQTTTTRQHSRCGEKSASPRNGESIDLATKDSTIGSRDRQPQENYPRSEDDGGAHASSHHQGHHNISIRGQGDANLRPSTGTVKPTEERSVPPSASQYLGQGPSLRTDRPQRTFPHRQPGRYKRHNGDSYRPPYSGSRQFGHQMRNTGRREGNGDWCC